MGERPQVGAMLFMDDRARQEYLFKQRPAFAIAKCTVKSDCVTDVYGNRLHLFTVTGGEDKFAGHQFDKIGKRFDDWTERAFGVWEALKTRRRPRV